MISLIWKAFAASDRLTDVTHDIGAEHINRMEAAPRIVWVPAAEHFRPGSVKAGTGRTDPRRSVETRMAGVRIKGWAVAVYQGAHIVDHIEAAEELLRRTIVVLHSLGFGSFTVDSLDWEGGDGSEVMHMGRAWNLHVTFQIPIYETPDESDTTTATLITGTQTTVADFSPDGTSANDASGSPGV